MEVNKVKQCLFKDSEEFILISSSGLELGTATHIIDSLEKDGLGKEVEEFNPRELTSDDYEQLRKSTVYCCMTQIRPESESRTTYEPLKINEGLIIVKTFIQ